MKDELYLRRARLRYNSDFNQNVVFEEYINGPMEEPNLIAFDVDIEKFKWYENKKKQMRKKLLNLTIQN